MRLDFVRDVEVSIAACERQLNLLRQQAAAVQQEIEKGERALRTFHEAKAAFEAAKKESTFVRRRFDPETSKSIHARALAWFAENNGGPTQCAKALGLEYNTVRNIWRSIKTAKPAAAPVETPKASPTEHIRANISAMIAAAPVLPPPPPPPSPPPPPAGEALTSADLTAAVRAYVLAHPGAKSKEIAAALGIRPHQARGYLAHVPKGERAASPPAVAQKTAEAPVEQPIAATAKKRSAPEASPVVAAPRSESKPYWEPILAAGGVPETIIDCIEALDEFGVAKPESRIAGTAGITVPYMLSTKSQKVLKLAQGLVMDAYRDACQRAAVQ
jgi:hypothetical protein